MGIELILAIIGFVAGLLITPLFVIVVIKGLRSLREVRDLMGRPPGDYGRLAGPSTPILDPRYREPRMPPK